MTLGDGLNTHIIYCPNQDLLRVKQYVIENYTKTLGFWWDTWSSQ